MEEEVCSEVGGKAAAAAATRAPTVFIASLVAVHVSMRLMGNERRIEDGNGRISKSRGGEAATRAVSNDTTFDDLLGWSTSTSMAGKTPDSGLFESLSRHLLRGLTDATR